MMVSVCIATYNGSQYIEEQLRSILLQLSFDDEIIISDDGSTDNTLEVICSLRDDRIKLVINEGEHGYTSNFENALKKARGDIIFLSDQDDIWCPNKVTVCLASLIEYDLVVSDAILIDASNNIIEDSFYDIRKPFTSFLGCVFKFGYLGCCLAFKRNILQKVLPFPRRHDLCTHDNWIFLVSLAFFKVKIVNEGLIFYRRHASNTSNGGLVNQTSFLFKIKYRIYLVYNLLKRI